MEKKLLCLPFAGSSSTWYKRWVKYLDESISIETIELAGRGKNIKKPLYKSIIEAVDDIYQSIPEELYEKEYFLFGHSMGATLSYELAYKIVENGYPPPRHIFFSGRLSPEQCISQRKIYNLPHQEFRDEVLKLGGTSSEIFDEKELKELFVPIMRADYKMLEEHHYVKYMNLLPCSISVLYGMKDTCTPVDKIYAWTGYTMKECMFHPFPGGHFFIKDYEEDVVKVINEEILKK